MSGSTIAILLVLAGIAAVILMGSHSRRPRVHMIDTVDLMRLEDARQSGHMSRRRRANSRCTLPSMRCSREAGPDHEVVRHQLSAVREARVPLWQGRGRELGPQTFRWANHKVTLIETERRVVAERLRALLSPWERTLHRGLAITVQEERAMI